jgi:hypothetical protein
LTSARPIPNRPFDRSVVVPPCSKMVNRRGISSAIILGPGVGAGDSDLSLAGLRMNTNRLCQVGGRRLRSQLKSSYPYQMTLTVNLTEPSTIRRLSGKRWYSRTA